MKNSRALKDFYIEQLAGAGFPLCKLGYKEEGDDYTDFGLPGKVPGAGFPKTRHQSPIDPRKFPHNYGVVLGDQWIVFDIDPRHFPKGRNCWKEFQTDHGIDLEKLCGFYVETGGGGTHYYFKKSKKILIRNHLKDYPGVEFKSKGRQVVGPGSIHPDTLKIYIPHGNPMDITELPAKVLETIRREDIALEAGLDKSDDSNTNKALTRQVLANHPAAISGERGNDTTFQAACICRDNGLSRDAALELLEEYNERCEPLWTVDDLTTLVNNAYRYGQNAFGSKNIRQDFDIVKDDEIQEVKPNSTPTLRALSLDEFLLLEIPPKKDILSPIIQTQCLIMIYAKRGVGKTYLALAIAYAIASGGSFLKWQATKPHRVLYLDGEMPANVMQDRLHMIQKAADKALTPGYFKIVNADLNPDTTMPDLSTVEGRKMVEPLINDFDVIVVDNISTLSRTGKENEAESWVPMQQWALDMRRRGKTVIFVHHAGKGGEQRGTSKREDVLDLVMKLEQPKDYNPEEGARFEIHFEKARHIYGASTQSFEVMIAFDEWNYREIEDIRLQKIVELKEQGMSFKDIEDETGIKKSTAQRMYRNYEEEQKECG